MLSSNVSIVNTIFNITVSDNRKGVPMSYSSPSGTNTAPVECNNSLPARGIVWNATEVRGGGYVQLTLLVRSDSNPFQLEIVERETYESIREQTDIVVPWEQQATFLAEQTSLTLLEASVLALSMSIHEGKEPSSELALSENDIEEIRQSITSKHGRASG